MYKPYMIMVMNDNKEESYYFSTEEEMKAWINTKKDDSKIRFSAAFKLDQLDISDCFN